VAIVHRWKKSKLGGGRERHDPRGLDCPSVREALATVSVHFLYVNDVDGRAIGYFDLQTGARVIKLPTEFKNAVPGWLSHHPEVTKSSTLMPVSRNSGAEEPPVSEEPPASPGRAAAIDQTEAAGTPSNDDEPWTDLAKNLPSQAVRSE
jgi:hypothetical protein